MIIFILFLLSLFVEIEGESWNRCFDVITILYSVALVAFLYFGAKKIFRFEETNEDKKAYVWKKRSKILTWQQRMAGTWTKLERTHFYEVSIFVTSFSFFLSLSIF
jgi:hypothetical protein